MRNFERRIRKLEGELNIGDTYESAWWEWFRKTRPESYQDLEDFFQRHQNDPDFVSDTKGTGWSDKTINEFADFCLARIQERRKANKYPPKVGNQGGQEDLDNLFLKRPKGRPRSPPGRER